MHRWYDTEMQYLESSVRKNNSDFDPPGRQSASQMGTEWVAQVTRTCPLLVQDPTNGHLSQSHNS